jgi:RNA polymerase sigma-70 factor (ECF subfamily)
MINAVDGPITPEQQLVLDRLIERYRYPAYVHVRAQGLDPDDAEDLVQDFFANWLHKGLFGKADKARGRFRTYLLTSLNNFIKNSNRNKHAQRRWPAGGFAEEDPDLIADTVSPVDEFSRAFSSEMTRSVLTLLEQECRQTGKNIHYSIFQRRVVEPALDGAEAPSMKLLANQNGLTEKQAANCLVTMKRAYQRLLESQILEYAASAEDVRQEMRDLMGYLRIT